jgi:hypothetical protein
MGSDAIVEVVFAEPTARQRRQNEWNRGLRERHGDDALRQE